MPGSLVPRFRTAARSGAAVREPGSALLWSFGNTIFSKVGGLAIGVVLARVLGPEEFGSYAVAFIALMAILAFNDLGVSLAIVRWTDEPEDVAPTVNTVSIASSVVLTAGVLLAAGPFARAMGDPGAASLVRLLGLCVLINGVVATPAALLQRYFRADRRTYADQVNVWLGAVVSLALALAGVGAMSLVVGRLAGATVSAGMLLAFSPIRYRLGLDRALLRRLIDFGLPLAGASLVVFAIGFVDQLAVGHVLGTTALGAYVLAYNLANWPVQIISQPLRNVAPAVLARQQHDPHLMRRTFRQMTVPLGIVALPGCAALAAAAPDVIAFVYGDSWMAAAEPLRWLAVFAGFRILFELCYDFVVVAGSSRPLLGVQVLWLGALLPLVVVGLDRFGLAGAAFAQVVMAALVIGPAYLLVLRRLDVPSLPLIRNLIWPAVGAGILAAVIVMVRGMGAPAWQNLLVAGVASGLTVGGLAARSRSSFTVWRVRDGVEREGVPA